MNEENDRKWNQRGSQGLHYSGPDFELVNGKHLQLKKFPPQTLMMWLRRIIKTTSLEIVQNKDITKEHAKIKVIMLGRWDYGISSPFFFFQKLNLRLLQCFQNIKYVSLETNLLPQGQVVLLYPQYSELHPVHVRHSSMLVDSMNWTSGDELHILLGAGE